MELTIEQVLQQAVVAHNAGKVEEADRAYHAILRSQPKHPDANLGQRWNEGTSDGPFSY